MASSSYSVSVDVGIQTDEFVQSSAEKLETNDSTTCSDSDESFGLKSFIFQEDEKLSSCYETETDLESICPDSICSSYTNTRRNSITSDSDLEVPFHLLFQSSASSVSSQSRTDSSSTNTTVLEGLDTLLHRLTSERFLELRRIQLGERPVTGGNARENLESFFHRAVHGPSEEERIREDEANRPVHVQNDVHHLRQQSLVQSALQNDFRRQLEQALRSRAASSSTETTTTQPRVPRNVQPVAPPRQATAGSSAFRSHLENLFSNRVNEISSTDSRRPAFRTQPNRSNPNSIPPPPPVEAPQSQHLPRSHHQQIPQNQTQTSNLQITIETGLQLLTESITEDLNRLQSLQVVSNMLRTDFRDTLEHMVQSRVQEVGNGEAVQHFIHSLPSSSPQRVQRQSSQRQSSQLQASMNANTNSEIHSLRQQLDEMKRMMAMSMEIQMDTQRAIRQEVSAIFTTFMQDYLLPRTEQQMHPHPTIFHPPRSTVVSSGQCVICIDRNVDTVLYQCGHMCVCNQCGLQLKIDGHNCPMCRAPIRDVIRAYQTQSQ